MLQVPILILGYEIESRKDRSDSANRGGILTLCRHDLVNLVFLCHSESCERSWHSIERDSGSIVLGNWYRPPSEDTCIESLRSELEQVREHAEDVIICGDLNVHHQRWLRVSNSNSAFGERLHTFTQVHGLVQLVREPTRENYLLDLVLSNMDTVKVS